MSLYLKNHQSRPISFIPFVEVNATLVHDYGCEHGCDHGRGYFYGCGRHNFKHYGGRN